MTPKKIALAVALWVVLILTLGSFGMAFDPTLKSDQTGHLIVGAIAGALCALCIREFRGLRNKNP